MSNEPKRKSRFHPGNPDAAQPAGAPEGYMRPCATCDGTGIVMSLTNKSLKVPCPSCDGTGIHAEPEPPVSAEAAGDTQSLPLCDCGNNPVQHGFRVCTSCKSAREDNPQLFEDVAPDKFEDDRVMELEYRLRNYGDEMFLKAVKYEGEAARLEAERDDARREVEALRAAASAMCFGLDIRSGDDYTIDAYERVHDKYGGNIANLYEDLCKALRAAARTGEGEGSE